MSFLILIVGAESIIHIVSFVFLNSEEDKARVFKEGADGFLAKKAIDYYPFTLQPK